MASDMSEAIRQLVQDRGISEELVLKTIENTLLAAYKRRFGTADNAVVRFNDDYTKVSIFAKKKIVDGVYDPVSEIDLEEARELDRKLKSAMNCSSKLIPKNSTGLQYRVQNKPPISLSGKFRRIASTRSLRIRSVKSSSVIISGNGMELFM